MTDAERRIWELAAQIAERNTYMSPTCDQGGSCGGPGHCEYQCGHVIAAAIREQMAKEEQE